MFVYVYRGYIFCVRLLVFEYIQFAIHTVSQRAATANSAGAGQLAAARARITRIQQYFQVESRCRGAAAAAVVSELAHPHHVVVVVESRRTSARVCIIIAHNTTHTHTALIYNIHMYMHTCILYTKKLACTLCSSARAMDDLKTMLKVYVYSMNEIK